MFEVAIWSRISFPTIWVVLWYPVWYCNNSITIYHASCSSLHPLARWNPFSEENSGVLSTSEPIWQNWTGKTMHIEAWKLNILSLSASQITITSACKWIDWSNLLLLFLKDSWWVAMLHNTALGATFAHTVAQALKQAKEFQWHRDTCPTLDINNINAVSHNIICLICAAAFIWY